MRGRAIIYSAEELRWLETKQTMPLRDRHAAFVATFDRAEVTPVQLNALQKRMGWRTGRSGQFVPGLTPHNKGKPFAPGGRSAETRFKPGTRQGLAAMRYQPIGTERVSKEGYRQIKVNDGQPFHKRWRLVHVMAWECVNGAVPEGHALKCLDGDRQNCLPENWIAVPRALLPYLAGRWASVAFDNAPAELKPALLAIARLKDKARKARRAKTEPGA